jgi:hypothetical protein
MTTYDRLKRIIPPDQALANQALSRSLRQVKDIFQTDLPSFAQAVEALESNKDLDLINALDTPIPPVVTGFINTVVATGTGPGNTVTINDVIGVAAGNTVSTELPVATTILQNLSSSGALVSLTANTGNPNSAVNGVYTVMSYALISSLSAPYITTVDDGNGNIISYTLTLPSNQYLSPIGGVSSWTAATFDSVVDSAFSANLIPAANLWITNIASNNQAQAQASNQATDAIAQQLLFNQTNSIAAGIDIGNVVNDLANANLVPNSITSALSLGTRLHDIGTDITEGGASQFFQATARTNTLAGQAVISSMREGRNIATLNAVGIQLDTQLVDINPNTTVANNLDLGQYTVAEATANIVL